MFATTIDDAWTDLPYQPVFVPFVLDALERLAGRSEILLCPLHGELDLAAQRALPKGLDRAVEPLKARAREREDAAKGGQRAGALPHSGDPRNGPPPIALVGHTGSGKTSIINMIMRFYDPIAGAVRIDEQDLRDVQVETLRRQMAMVLQDGADDAARDLSRRTHERWEQRRHDVERPILEPGELFFSPNDIAERLDGLAQTILPASDSPAPKTPQFASRPPPDLHIHERGKEPAAALTRFSEDFSGRVLFAADTPGRREVLRNTLASGLHLPPEDVASKLQQAGIDPRRRAQALSLEEWARVTRALAPYPLRA